MDLRPRKRQFLNGFTIDEIEKMENLVNESREQVCDPKLCKKLANMFTYSKDRAGKPAVKWTEVQTWFQSRLQCCPSKENPVKEKANESSDTAEGQIVPDLSELVFEARSSKDGAWYDIETFISHRFLDSGEPEVLVRYVGFGPEEDEWVNVRKAIRERSVGLEHSECNKVKVGDLILCFQEGKNQARYLEAHVIEIQKRLHDIRGCRCLFVIRYCRDNTKEAVRLWQLCVRPSTLGRP